ncbi:hypothetical protein TNCV_5112591 [Trichonephila clavipes]|nr:hypothetical protein TNCV_5112591 [Trichonephila clavipes]
MEYLHPRTPSVKKFKTLMSTTKVMLDIFWDASGHTQDVHAQTQDVVRKLNFTVVPQPPYSPDLAPSNFCLFTKLKETFKGQRFPKFRQPYANKYAANHNLSP